MVKRASGTHRSGLRGSAAAAGALEISFNGGFRGENGLLKSFEHVGPDTPSIPQTPQQCWCLKNKHRKQPEPVTQFHAGSLPSPGQTRRSCFTLNETAKQKFQVISLSTGEESHGNQ